MKTVERDRRAPVKVLMLDFGGVLDVSVTGHDHSGTALNKNAVRRLNTIVEPEDVVVVVTSELRRNQMRVELQELLTNNGFTGLVLDKTPYLKKPRGLEIKEWLTNTRRNVVSFAILDDGNDFNEFGRDRLVCTSYSGGGLLDEHVDKVRQVLAQPWKGLNR